MRRVVITGVGAVSPLGCGNDVRQHVERNQALCAGFLAVHREGDAYPVKQDLRAVMNKLGMKEERHEDFLASQASRGHGNGPSCLHPPDR